MAPEIKESVSIFYYTLSAISLFLVFIRLVYTWFKDYDNSKRFICDMAEIHLPYMYESLNRIARKLDVQLEATPPVRFTTPGHNPS